MKQSVLKGNHLSIICKGVYERNSFVARSVFKKLKLQIYL